VLAQRGPLAVRTAVECILQACEALAEAHALGIVHRDLKPANLFLTECADGSPCVKVLDFGISRMAPRHGLASLTDPGTVLGTPSYMAPEQMEGVPTLDCRSDIWALGAILYELLVGRSPYGNDALPKLFVRVMRSPTPRPSHHRPHVPAGVDAVVARCLAVDRAYRFSSVAELALALSAAVPSARDAARRVTRVLDRRRNEDLGGSSAPALALDIPPREHGPVRRTVVAALASAVVLGIGALFGALAARSAVGVTAPQTAPSGAAAARLAKQGSPVDTASLIAPSVRSREVAPGAAARPARGGAAATPAAEARNLPADSGAAVADPGRSPHETPLSDQD